MKQQSARTFFFAQAGFTAAFCYLTSGVFLSGLALLMGAGDVVVSYVSIILNLCGVLILFFSPLLERFRSRKKLALALTALSRLATLFLVVIPALVPAGLQLALFLPVVVVAFALQAQTTVVLNQWMLNFVDEAHSGRYISRRQTLTLAVNVVLSLVGGWWMDRMEEAYLGFAVLFGVAGVMGLGELILLARVPDGPPYVSAAGGCRLRDLARIPLRDRRFAGFVGYIVAFYLLLYIADSYTMVYLMKYLALPYQTVTGLYLLMSLPQIVLLGVWGRISDRKGHAFVLKASIWLFTGETFFLAFASSEYWWVFVPVSFLISSAANSGFVISVFNRRYELMPAENRIVYDNFFSAAIGLGFLLGPMLGGGIKALVEASPAAEAVPFAGIRVLYLISTAGIVLLQVVVTRRTRGEGLRDGGTGRRGRRPLQKQP